MATVDQVTMKVQRLLTGNMGLRIEVIDGDFILRFSDVSTVLRVSILDWSTPGSDEPETIVCLTAPVLFGVKPTPELFKWIAMEGNNTVFGHLRVMEDHPERGGLFIQFRHNLLGDYLDEKELEHAIWAVLHTADAIDDELQQRFGGTRFIEE